MDGPSRLARQYRGFNTIIRLALATKTGPKQGHIDEHIRRCHPHHRTNRLLDGLRILGRSEHVTSRDLSSFVSRHVRHGTRGFHRSMRQVRNRIVGFHHFGRLLHGFIRIPRPPQNFAWLLGRTRQFLGVYVRIVIGVGTVIPFNRKCIPSLPRRPSAGRANCNSTQR